MDVSGSFSSLSSKSNAYGPWIYEDVDVQLPPSGATGLHFENRHASDRFNPTTVTQLTLDSYVPISHAATLYAAASSASGAPYWRDRFEAQMDVKAGGGFVLTGGAAFGSGYGTGSMHRLSAGFFYYFGDDYFSLRYVPVWSSLLGGMPGYQASLALGHPGRTVHTLRFGTGLESDVSLLSPVNPTILGERESAVGYTIKHWTGSNAGFHAGIEFGTLSRSGGARIYSRTAVSAGAFFAL